MRAAGAVARCKVVARPEPISREEYAKAATEIEERLASLPSLVALYRTGSVSAPGISDLDRVAVLRRPERIDSAWRDLSKRTRIIAMHGPFAVDVDTFERHRWFAHLESLELVSGSSVAVRKPPPTDYLAHLSGAEGIVISLLRVQKQLWTGRIKARAMLCELHALRHSLRLAGLTTLTAPTAHRLVEDADELRRAWFLEDPARRELEIKAIAGRAQPALLDALNGLPSLDTAVDRRQWFLAMGPPWRNVIVAGAPDEADPRLAFRIPWTVRLTARSRRLGELHWRLQRHRLPLPAPAAGWLQQPRRREPGALRAERDRIVRRYSEFVDACGEGWSSIGFASSFLQP